MTELESALIQEAVESVTSTMTLDELRAFVVSPYLDWRDTHASLTQVA